MAESGAGSVRSSPSSSRLISENSTSCGCMTRDEIRTATCRVYADFACYKCEWFVFRDKILDNDEFVNDMVLYVLQRSKEQDGKCSERERGNEDRWITTITVPLCSLCRSQSCHEL